MDDRILDAIFSNDGEFNLNEEKAALPAAVGIQVRQQELDAIQLAETQDFDKAFKILDEIISKYPQYGSAYNNRAQMHRLRGDDQKSLLDLEKAIEFGDEKVLKQAYTQRAVIKKKAGDEEGAELDFQKGAQYGNQLAKNVVKSNPFAKLCNEMLAEVMNREK